MAISVNDDGSVNVQTQGDILDELNASFVSEFGPDFDVTDDSFTYQQNAIWSNRESALQSAIAAAIASLDIDHAVGQQLDIIGSLLEVPRQTPTRSTVPAVLTGTPGASVGDKRVKYLITGDLWRTPIDAVIEPNGTLAVDLTSEATGAIFATAQATTAWTIVDVTTGFVSVESTGDAQRGRSSELAPPYRVRLKEASASGDATVPAVKRDIGAAAGVTSFTVDFNNTPLINANGVPAWHLEAVVSGGTDSLIATTLYNVVGGTTGYHGNTSVIVVDPVDGAQVEIKFSRITNKQVTAALVLQRSADTPLPVGAETTAITAVANRINTNGAGIDVDPGDLIAAASQALPSGTVQPDDSTCTVAFFGSGGQVVPLVITPRENAFTTTLAQPAVVTGTLSPSTFNLTAGDSLVVAAGDGQLTTLDVFTQDYFQVSAATITEIVASFSRQAPAGMTIGSSGGALVLASTNTGPTASVTIDVASTLALLATLGMSSGITTGAGPNVTVAFVGP